MDVLFPFSTQGQFELLAVVLFSFSVSRKPGQGRRVPTCDQRAIGARSSFRKKRLCSAKRPGHRQLSMVFAVLQLLLWSFKYLLLHIKHLPKTWVHIPLTSSPNCCRPQVTSIHGLKDDLFVDNLSKLRELRTRQKHPDNNDGWVLAWRTRCCCGLQWIARLFGAACLRALIIFTFLALIHKGVYILFISQRLVLSPTFYHTRDRKLNFHMSWKLTKYLHYAGLLAGV